LYERKKKTKNAHKQDAIVVNPGTPLLSREYALKTGAKKKSLKSVLNRTFAKLREA